MSHHAPWPAWGLAALLLLGAGAVRADNDPVVYHVNDTQA